MKEYLPIRETILKAIQPVFREVFEDPDLVVTRELDANSVENWDSLNHITLIVELETLTDCCFTTDELVELQNVGDFIDLLEKKGYEGA